MGSAYLQAQDYATYGLPVTTTPAQVTQASTLIDGTILKRREGLIWTPDARGGPCYMAALTPTLTLTAPGSISPGLNVVVPVTGAMPLLNFGDVLILDRANPDLTEAVVVNAIVPGVSIGLVGVVTAHSAGALLEGGLVIQEQKFMPNNRPLVVLSRTPVAAILGGSGRYGYGRRGDTNASSINDFNLLAALSKFGGPPAWEIFNPATSDIDSNTGQLWIPAGVLIAYYTEVKVRYIAGFTAATLPDEVKLATAMVITALSQLPGVASLKSYRAGGTAIERFADSSVGADVRDMLQAYKVRAFA